MLDNTTFPGDAGPVSDAPPAESAQDPVYVTPPDQAAAQEADSAPVATEAAPEATSPSETATTTVGSPAAPSAVDGAEKLARDIVTAIVNAAVGRGQSAAELETRLVDFFKGLAG